jgi:RimJ/RimL family protein N-acetyltransferase
MPLSPDAWPVFLETERLRLRPVRSDDRAWLYDLQTNSKAREFLGGARDHAAAVQGVDAIYAAGGGWLVAESRSGQRLGVLSGDEHRGDVEVSYVFDPSGWGKGLATEALVALVGWAADAYKVASVIAVTQTANVRSLRLLKRCGFIEEARFMEYGDPQVQLRRPITSDD